MNPSSADRSATGAGRSRQIHRWRSRKDAIATWVIAVGGIGVIAAVGLIFFYLLWVVMPLFIPASAESRAVLDNFSPGSQPVWLSAEESNTVGFRIGSNGSAFFFNLTDGRIIEPVDLPGSDGTFTMVARQAGDPELLAIASGQGQLYLLRHRYAMDYSEGVEARTVIPTVEFPYGEEALVSVEGQVVDLALADDERELTLAALDEQGVVALFRARKQFNPITEEHALEAHTTSHGLDFAATRIAIRFYNV
jgi:phosphate transport system permease protein